VSAAAQPLQLNFELAKSCTNKRDFDGGHTKEIEIFSFNITDVEIVPLDVDQLQNGGSSISRR
jgi:hypothetical protein